jgi:hypothetical protein
MSRRRVRLDGDSEGIRLQIGMRFREDDTTGRTAPRRRRTGRSSHRHRSTSRARCTTPAGPLSFVHESCLSAKHPRWPQATCDQLLDIQLLLYDEMLKLAVERPVNWKH